MLCSCIAGLPGNVAFDDAMRERSNLDWLLKAARRVGIDLSSAAQDLDAESGGRTAANELTLENYFKLLSMAEMLSGDSDIGLHIGEVVDLSELGVYGHVLLYAATVDEYNRTWP